MMKVKVKMAWALVNWFNFCINNDKLSVGEKQLTCNGSRQTDKDKEYEIERKREKTNKSFTITISEHWASQKCPRRGKIKF